MDIADAVGFNVTDLRGRQICQVYLRPSVVVALATLLPLSSGRLPHMYELFSVLQLYNRQIQSFDSSC